MTQSSQPAARTRRLRRLPRVQPGLGPASAGPGSAGAPPSPRRAEGAAEIPGAHDERCATTSNARTIASRRNGAGSTGPWTAAGKARAARNALKHGFAARKLVLLDDENPAEFRAFAKALQAELAPEGRLQIDLVGRIAMAAWRARRADRLEAGVLGSYLEDADPDPCAALATGLTRDNHGPGAFATLVRYRGSVLAEFFRSLAALKALQAEAGALGAADLPPAARPSPPLLQPNEPKKTP
jgi:hypothetical protein